MALPQHELLTDLRERMVRIETKLDTQTEYASDSRKEIDHLDKRLDKVENRQAIIASGGAIVLFIVTFFQDNIHRIMNT